MGEGARDIEARVSARPSALGLAALALAIVAFPLFKVQAIEHLSALKRFGTTGAGPGGTLDTLGISIAVAAGVAVLGAVFVRTGSLQWPILLHFAWNAIFFSLNPKPV